MLEKYLKIFANLRTDKGKHRYGRRSPHIKPWSGSHDDRPTNGFALCRLCHWSFDEGLMSVGKDYEVLVSKRVRTEQNCLGHILTLIDRPIFKPDKQIYCPDKNNLEWHRKKKFAIRA